MAQYDIHQGADGTLMVDIQADALNALNTRIVIPLLPLNAAPPVIRQLNPQVMVDGQPHMIATQFLSAVHKAEMGPAVGTLKSVGDKVSLALDLVLHGI